MDIAVIKDNQCINVCLFNDLQTAQNFLAAGVWPGASEVLEAPEGYGIGDGYADGVWTKAPSETPKPVEPMVPTPTLSERLAAAETKNKQLSAQLTAAGKQIEMLEGCVIELAQTVYA